ncbi:MAG: arginase family protein [Bacteroidales bacterium]|nr:arginase family protein [Bacteroidales bacterium]
MKYILDYFQPVSLERPSFEEYFLHQHSFCKHIDIHTPNHKPEGKYEIALIGITENRGSYASDISNGTDIIRNKLYLLNFFSRKTNIADLGNLKSGQSISDTYYGIRDVCLELFSHGILPIFFGGSQDITYGIYLAFESMKKKYSITTVDYQLDCNFENIKTIHFLNYLNQIILNQENLFELCNIGHQQCFEVPPHSNLLENLFYENIRLGLVRGNVPLVEPYLRDSNIVSIDISSVKHADAPGQIISSPNGFSAEEICQMARYAGVSDGVQTMGIYNYSPANDIAQVTASLIAQIIWYFIEGYTYRLNENPKNNSSGFQQFYVTLNDEHHLKFYKSKISHRWWTEVPARNGENIYIACTENDYLQALKNEIPDRWIKIFKKLN